jgi:hypothetical protein
LIRPIITWRLYLYKLIPKESIMATPIGKGKASEIERTKLIEEMQQLIQDKQLDVNLTMARPAGPTLKGCSTCTMCPCMICN